MEVGDTTSCFLDLNISLVDNQLFTTVYSKPTDSHHANSCRKRSSMNGIQKGVALSLRRICSTLEEYQLKSREYMTYLIARGHPAKNVQSTFQQIESAPRNEARKKITRPLNRKSIIFAAAFNPRGPNVSEILKRNLYLLESNATLKELFPEGSITVANRRGENLKHLVRGDPYNLKSDLEKKECGYIKCGKKCDSCNNFVLSTTFVICYATGRKFYIRVLQRTLFIRCFFF